MPATEAPNEYGIALDALMHYEGPERPIAVGDYVMTRATSTLGRLLVMGIVGSKAIVTPAPYHP